MTRVERHQIRRHPDEDYGNRAGADNVMSWRRLSLRIDFTTKLPHRIQASSPRSICSAQGSRRALVVAADPWSTLPQAALDHLARIPRVVIDRKVTPASLAARVHFTTAAPGIGSTGTAYRMDKVPLRLRSALPSPHGTDEDVLRGIHDAITTV